MCTAITSHIYFLYNLFDSSLQIFLASSEYLGNLKHLVTVIISILYISVKDFFGRPVSSWVVQKEGQLHFHSLRKETWPEENIVFSSHADKKTNFCFSLLNSTKMLLKHWVHVCLFSGGYTGNYIYS